MDFLQDYSFIITTGIGIVLFFAYNKLHHYLQIIYVLIDAIELIDANIKDILTDKQLGKILKIKRFVANKLKASDRKKLDELLKRKGYKS